MKQNFRGHRTGKVEEFLLKNIKDVNINKFYRYSFSHIAVSSLFELSFEYNNGRNYYKTKRVLIDRALINDLIKALEVRKIKYNDNYNLMLSEIISYN